MTSEKQSYLGEQQVQALNDRHGYFEYGDAQGDVSSAFANEAVAAYLRVNEEAQAVMAECGLSPRELLERCSAMEAALNECKDALEWVVEQGGGPACEHEGGIVCFCKENNAINAARAALAKHNEV